MLGAPEREYLASTTHELELAQTSADVMVPPIDLDYEIFAQIDSSSHELAPPSDQDVLFVNLADSRLQVDLEVVSDLFIDLADTLFAEWGDVEVEDLCQFDHEGLLTFSPRTWIGFL